MVSGKGQISRVAEKRSGTGTGMPSADLIAEGSRFVSFFA
jgi:hypothetical protein